MALRVILFIFALYASNVSANQNLLINPGAETGDLTGWTVGGVSNPGVDNGSFDSSIKPFSGSYDFFGRTGSNGTLSQYVNLLSNGFTTTQIDSGKLKASFSFYEQGLSQGNPSDDASVTLTFLGSSSSILGSFSSGEIDSHNGNWQQYNGSSIIPVGTTSIEYTMNFIRHSGSDLDAFIDNNQLSVSSAVPAPAAIWLWTFGSFLTGLIGFNRRK